MNKKSKEKKKSEKEKNHILIKNNINNNINNNIINDNNISNIKSANDEGIEDDLEEIFGSKKQKELFDNKMILNKKIIGHLTEKNEEMNPTFLNDIKTNKEFEAEQELMKSLKKENKDISTKSNKSNGELSKEDIDLDFNNSHFNFDYFFFEQQDNNNNEENEFNGNYEDFKFKSLIDNLNTENPFPNEEQKGKLDSLLNSNINNSNKEEESNEEKEETEKEDSFKVNEYEKLLFYKKKFDNNFNYYDYLNNNDKTNNEEKFFHNKFDESQKAFEKIWRK